MKLVFSLPGLHRVTRGAEIAFIEIGKQLAAKGAEVTLIGSGPPIAHAPYRYIQTRAIPRERFERFPKLPIFRNDTAWEEASFVPGLLKSYRPRDYDVTLTCAYPLTNWTLRRPVLRGPRPAHVFVTQNGDWPAQSDNAEFRFFGCDGLVCTNPDFLERNRDRYRAALIPNGVDLARFCPGRSARDQFDLPENAPVVLMVSALIPSKFVDRGIRAVSRIPNAQLVVAGDGPMRAELNALADQLMPGRYRALAVPADGMPDLYRSADVFLHLSQDESFGNVYVEAMACGTPVVACATKRTRWILGDAATLVADGEDGELAAAIEHAISPSESISKRLVSRARRFSWDSVADRYLAFLEEVVDNRRRSAK